MPSYQQVPIGLEPETIRVLDRLADDENTDYSSRAEIVREYVNQGLEAEEHPPSTA